MNREDKQFTIHYKNKRNAGEGVTVNIHIQNAYILGNKNIQLEQRAEGGGQINRNVGTNANQGGQNAIDHSSAQNNQSQFANGNGRSGIAGNNNDEAGGQQGIKVRDSLFNNSSITSSSIQSQSEIDETVDEGLIDEATGIIPFEK
ncbi:MULTISPECIES: hypothetical protein [Bacillaceae]|uniref:hypothetical protein n=1 Tax=Metabacillus sp. 22489 TaxID=3453928 RepID=UPI00201DB9E5